MYNFLFKYSLSDYRFNNKLVVFSLAFVELVLLVIATWHEL
jgi:hypothetical protein